MEPKDIDDSSIRIFLYTYIYIYIYKSIRKRKAISRVDQVQSIIDDNAIVADSSVMLVGSSQERIKFTRWPSEKKGYWE